MALTRIDPTEFAARRDAIVALDAAARLADGHGALGEPVWRDLGAPGTDSVGFLADDHAYLHLARADPRDGATRWIAGVVRLPNARTRGITTMLLDAAIGHAAARGGGVLACWVFGATDADEVSFSGAGFRRARELFEMRVPLPIAEVAAFPSDITVRPFEPGRDVGAWLRVNNRAFAGHPDQGGWDDTTLRARMAEPWFDPTLFLLADDADGLAGFDWLKLHAERDADPALGEIYVIGVDPRAQGTGLGRALAVAGLGVVHARGAGTGMLFCASDNAGALSLYRSLGFSVHRTDRAYERAVVSK